MESVASNSTPPPQDDHHHHHHLRQQPRLRSIHPVTDRIARALRHHLRLLHRSESTFFVLGATGNVYSVNLSSTPSCTCPDRITPCKHILFVYIRVLGVPLDDTCLRRRTLRPCQLNRLLGTPSLAESLAGSSLRQRFHQLFFQPRNSGDNNNNCNNNSSNIVEVEDGSMCPICLDEMEKGERVVACGTCRNLIHEECLMRWKRTRGRRSASCVICRARWRDANRINNDQDKYLNLAAYVSTEDDLAAEGSSCGGGGGDGG